ncbi:MAG TPA: DNRLRE domain-containing protein, partial [Lacipirellulaceae bacterium]|nr:DNRLRE domain-containing protein [Lacipirellulaceae bacterium]
MKHLCRRFVLMLALSSIATHVWSATVSIGASKDNSIFQSNADGSAGGAAAIFVGSNADISPRRGLIAFDVAGNVPAGSTITSAQLTLYLALSGNLISEAVELHRLTADWGEGTAGSGTPTIHFAGMGFDANLGDATWNERTSGSAAWSNPGADGDFNAAASASAIIGLPDPDPTNPTGYNWGSTAALVSDVQSWLDNPASNFGWMLINSSEDGAGSVRAFFSRSATLDTGGDPLQRDVFPMLTITYTTSVPEPVCGLLL